jgi:glutamate/tyrosine decarboxylase-like PLP-dependent enzyme
MPIDLSHAEREALTRAASKWILSYFDQAATPPLYPSISASALRAIVHEPLPREGQDPTAVLAQFALLATLARNNGHPRMFGYVQSSGSFAGVIGDFLASALNQNVTSWRSAPSATTVELQVIDWLKAWVGFDAGAEGVLLGGGSAANHAALAVALRASTDVDVNARGVGALPAPPRVYASGRVHMSIPKAAAMLGIGRDAVCTIPIDDRGQMQVAALDQQLARDRAEGLHPVCVVASAGEVNTGAIDPLDAIADVCQRHAVWFHVDGSYGALAIAASRARSALSGLGRADSLALDPHKWLFVPLDAGCLLVKDGAHLRQAFSHGASYVDVIADRDMSEFAFWDVSPELSRRFRALKIWFALKCHGAGAVIEAIDRNIALASELGSMIADSADFELLAPVSLSVVCFRFMPPSLRGVTGDEVARDTALNEFNRQLLVEVQRDGDAYVSNAMLGPRFALRACIVNYRTTSADLARLLTDIRSAAARIVVRS